jgi:hypothetical protein
MYLDRVLVTGTIGSALRQKSAPDILPDPTAFGETCSLDVADRGAHKLEEIGEVMSMVRERVRQIERGALAKLMKVMAAHAIDSEDA